MTQHVEQLEAQLDSFSSSVRLEALEELIELAKSGEVEFAQSDGSSNVHFHTFYSYNAEGYSPSKIAWLAKKAGLNAAGMVDFDVLDGLEEFYAAASLLGLKDCGGMETRVFVPEFSDKEINSPGEPGVAYHVGVGFPTADVPDECNDFKQNLIKTVRKRNEGLIGRVNEYLSSVVLDYEQDVLPLTPAGNATERHICLAYARKARGCFCNDEELGAFWSEKLGCDLDELQLPEGLGLLNMIRAKTMKRGGVGYVEPDAGSFPTMAEMNSFILAAGGIPTLAWLDGTSEGEKEIEKLLGIAMASGVAAVNIVPDRNYTAGLGEKDQKCKNLYEFVKVAEKLDLPIIVGTEMNSPGQKFVDDFSSAELSPLKDTFLKGAYIVYAHLAMQRQCRKGYLSEWAKGNFETISAKNEFFSELGKKLGPDRQGLLADLNDSVLPQQILNKIK